MSDERETLEIDVLFVGAGPASLAGACHLAGLVRRHNATAGQPLEISIAVLEKGREIGSHALSGAVVDPRALAELFPDDWQSAPFEAPVGKEEVLLLTAGGAHSLPIPPPLRNHGCYVASLGKLLKWMAPRVEAAGVDLFYEFPAVSALLEERRVVGVRTGDRGVGRNGERKANYEPGIDIRTRCVVLGEGPRGTLVKQLDAALGLWRGSNPQLYAIGLKEVWDVPPGRVAAGQVWHTLSWPLGASVFGGGFAYGMQNDQLIAGLVVGLDYQNPLFDPFLEFQRWKTHSAIARLLAGGKPAFYGAKAIPEGGWWSLPRLGGDGFLLVGDAAGFLNSQRLKGIHLAMKSGMLAAEAIFEELAGAAVRPPTEATRPPTEAVRPPAGAPGPPTEAVRSPTAAATAAQPLHQRYQAKVEASWIHEELWPVRNFHQAFDHGLPAAMLQAGLGLVTGGRGWGVRDRLPTSPGHERMVPLTSQAGRRLEPPPPIPAASATVDGTQLVFDRLADVYMSGTAHDEDQPVHLHVADPSICVTRCTAEYANPCERFCPAAVYEMVTEQPPATPEAPAPAPIRRLQINAANCVHCKTCDIMDPYGIITWVPPEGGGGPNYPNM
ncbi:MAG TPA: electron transfer flavoprotein-ubiquinone oxidoreductase [Thermoanaerobaculia bacterium]|nr:electron transfer flavoprotein-ubiquinone oxidoreductase [Thermoanaerobaculia bacterium]